MVFRLPGIYGPGRGPIAKVGSFFACGWGDIWKNTEHNEKQLPEVYHKQSQSPKWFVSVFLFENVPCATLQCNFERYTCQTVRILSLVKSMGWNFNHLQIPSYNINPEDVNCRSVLLLRLVNSHSTRSHCTVHHALVYSPWLSVLDFSERHKSCKNCLLLSWTTSVHAPSAHSTLYHAYMMKTCKHANGPKHLRWWLTFHDPGLRI